MREILEDSTWKREKSSLQVNVYLTDSELQHKNFSKAS